MAGTLGVIYMAVNIVNVTIKSKKKKKKKKKKYISLFIRSPLRFWMVTDSLTSSKFHGTNHGFGQAKFLNGGWALGSSQFSIGPALQTFFVKALTNNYGN